MSKFLFPAPVRVATKTTAQLVQSEFELDRVVVAVLRRFMRHGGPVYETDIKNYCFPNIEASRVRRWLKDCVREQKLTVHCEPRRVSLKPNDRRKRMVRVYEPAAWLLTEALEDVLRSAPIEIEVVKAALLR